MARVSSGHASHALFCVCAMMLFACGDGGSNKQSGQSSDAAVQDAGRDGGQAKPQDAGRSEDGGDSTVPDTNQNQSMVGPAGGMVALPSGARIEVPAGALAADVELSIRSVVAPEDAALGGVALGTAFVLGPEGQTFLKPVTVRVPFDPTFVPAGSSLSNARVVIAPLGSSDFVALDTEADLDARMLSAQTVHFSVVAPIAPTSPNPLRITTPSPLPTGQVGLAYGPLAFAASGGSAPLDWSVLGTLPAGLTLSSDGVLSGSPAAWGAFTFSVRVHDAQDNALEKAFELTVYEAMTPPTPVLASISPDVAVQGADAFQLSLTGTSFASGATVYFGTTALTTSYVSSTALTAVVPASALLAAGKVEVYVSNPGSGGSSESKTFTINASSQNPQPILSSITPTTVLSGAGDTQISVFGSSFISGSQVVLGGQGGQALVTTYVSTTELAAVVPAASLASTGDLTVSVYTPAPGGGYSPESRTLTVGSPNPLPVLSSMSPTSAPEGSAALTLTLTGTSFVSGAIVYFGNTALSTTFNSSSSLSATLPSALLAGAAVVSVSVVNPSPGGGASATQAFSVMASSGTLITSLTPSEARAGSDDLIIRMAGGPFGTMTRVSVDAGATFLRVALRYSNLIDFVLPKSALSAAGTLNVVVEQGGAISAAKAFAVVNTGNALPVLNSVSPNTLARAPGSSVTLTLTGSGFIAGQSKLYLGEGNATFYAKFSSSSSGSLSMSSGNAQAYFDLAGSLPIRVVNPSAGGGSSAPFSFTVTGSNPAPDLTSVSPSSVGTGTPELTFDLYYGSGSLSGTQLRVEKGGLYKEFCDGYTIKNAQRVCLVKLPATFFETAGDITFTFTNPAPGGGSDSLVVSVEQGNPTPVKATPNPNLTQIQSGSPTTTVSLTGGPFVANTTVLEVGSSTALNVSYVSASQINVQIPQNLLLAEGTLTLRASNPAPGGGAAPDVSIAVISGPQITTLDPSEVAANSSFTLGITGTGLNVGDFAQLQWRTGEGEWQSSCAGSPERSSTMWFVQAQACMVSTPGTVSVRAFIEGYPPSNALNLTVH